MTGAWLETEEDVIESHADLRNRLGEDLPEDRREEVINGQDIGDRTVANSMVAREETVALSTAEDWETNAARIRASPHARFPPVGEDFDDIRGVVYTPALFRDLEADGSGADLEAVAIPPMTVAPNTAVSDLIDLFQTERQELAVVRRGDRVVGLVTATDALEETTGELSDPLDEQFDMDSEYT